MSTLIKGSHPSRGTLYAAVDPSVRFVDSAVRDNRFAARLAPFRNHLDAQTALIAAGASLNSSE